MGRERNDRYRSALPVNLSPDTFHEQRFQLFPVSISGCLLSRLLKFCEFRSGALEDWYAGVGIFPKIKKIVIS